MIAWRVTKVRYHPLDPTGARLHGARWSSPGRGILYASDSFAGAILEILAHAFRPRTLPGAHHAVRISLPDDLVAEVSPGRIEGWEDADSGVARAVGDRWYGEGASPALLVPALPARPVGRALLLNPAHPEWPRIEVGDPFPVLWDERLFR